MVHSYPPLVLTGPPVRSTDPWNTSQISHAHRFNGPLSGTTRVNRYQKGKTNLDFSEATESEWQWHPLGHTQVCTSLQTDNHASNPPLSFLRTGCPSCRPTTEGRVCEMVPCPSIRLSNAGSTTFSACAGSSTQSFA